MVNVIDINNRLKEKEEQPNWEVINTITAELSKTENCADYTVHLDKLGQMADTLCGCLALCFANLERVYGSEWVSEAICDMCDTVMEQKGELLKFDDSLKQTEEKDKEDGN